MVRIEFNVVALTCCLLLMSSLSVSSVATMSGREGSYHRDNVDMAIALLNCNGNVYTVLLHRPTCTQAGSQYQPASRGLGTRLGAQQAATSCVR